VGLTWPAGTDNVGVVSYRVNRDNTLVGHTSTTSFTDTQVAASTAYSYTVETVDAAGNRSAPSAAVNVTTPAGAAGTLATSYTWTPRGTLTTVNNGTPDRLGGHQLRLRRPRPDRHPRRHRLRLRRHRA
jgi:hypothetical protein